MKRQILVVLATLAALSALVGGCQLMLLGDMQIRWTVNGAATPTQSLCLSYGIAKWKITADGPVYRELIVDCGSIWSSGEEFYRIEEGRYTIAISALNKYDQVLAMQSDALSLVSGTGVSTLPVFNFTATDFSAQPICGDNFCDTVKGESCSSCSQDCGPCAESKILVSWNINGSVNGQADGESFDSCAEVGASKAAVLVDNATYYLDCSAMGGEVLVDPGSHSVKIKLVNSSNADLTSWSQQMIVTTNVNSPGSAPTVEFYYENFYNSTSYHGDFLFSTTFEGKACSATNPPVAFRAVRLMNLDNSLITNAQLCDPTNTCKTATVDQPIVCNSDVILRIPNLVWGEYKLTVQGAASTMNTCWESTFDILVGAGSSNPVRVLDISRIQGRACP